MLATALTSAIGLAYLHIRYLNVTTFIAVVTESKDLIIGLCFILSIIVVGMALCVCIYRAISNKLSSANDSKSPAQTFPSTEPLPSSRFSLPINDPRYMAARQAGHKAWQV